ncbi:Fe-S oxidoreductase [Sinorhizobium fredii]|uniref:FAD-binding oxidoreductase n=1 Tax=Rhizobium fredii TaxID=380 RepID=UPI00030F2DEC|nr:FAD-binding protein [Sinorhizobium fredii]
MIPALAERPKTGRLYTDYLDALRHAKFAGDIEASAASTTVFSTDNSIYQLRPQAIMFPRRRADLVVIARLASEPRFHGVSFAMRGGGTGTNEQSLTDGIVIDMSRHMNRIVSIDPVKRTEGSLILVQDSFTSYFEPALLLDVIDLLLALGFKPFVAPLKPNGKALHIHGYLGAFERAAERNARHLCRLAASGVPPVGLDPSMTLCYRSEYPGALGAQKTPRVLLRRNG